VIEARVNGDSAFHVEVYHTVFIQEVIPFADPEDDQIQFPGGLPNAKVDLYEGDQFIETLVPASALGHIYVSQLNTRPMPGTEYKIEVSANNYAPASASAKAMVDVPISDYFFSGEEIQLGETNLGWANSGFQG